MQEAIQIIKKPIITEKAIKQGEKGKYAFYVSARATKIGIKQSIKDLYGVEVDTVRIITMPVKTRAYGRKTIIKRKKMKKAIVTLKDGKTIDVTKLKESKK